MPLRLTVPRGTNQIGGSCIEVVHLDATRIILNAGRPLDAPVAALDLLPATLDPSRPASVLVGYVPRGRYGVVAPVGPHHRPREPGRPIVPVTVLPLT